jgi:hypothetical protein
VVDEEEGDEGGQEEHPENSYTLAGPLLYREVI